MFSFDNKRKKNCFIFFCGLTMIIIFYNYLATHSKYVQKVSEPAQMTATRRSIEFVEGMPRSQRFLPLPAPPWWRSRYDEASFGKGKTFKLAHLSKDQADVELTGMSIGECVYFLIYLDNWNRPAEVSLNEGVIVRFPLTFPLPKGVNGILSWCEGNLGRNLVIDKASIVFELH